MESKKVKTRSRGLQVFKDVPITTYKIQKKVIKTGDKDTDVLVKEEVVAVSKENRSDVINSYASDVGVKNVLKKIALSGQDPSQVIASGKFAAQPIEVDISNMPDNLVEAYKAIEKGVKAYDQLPKDIRDKYSYKDIVENGIDLRKFLNKEVKSEPVIEKTQVIEKKEEVKVNE